MGKSKHTLEYDDGDWKCLGLYCDYIGTTYTAVFGELLNNLLVDKRSIIKELMAKQEKIMDSRKKN